MRIAAPQRPRVRDGRINERMACTGFSTMLTYPDAGSHRRKTANTRISNIPNQKVGVASASAFVIAMSRVKG